MIPQQALMDKAKRPGISKRIVDEETPERPIREIRQSMVLAPPGQPAAARLRPGDRGVPGRRKE